MTLTQSVLPNTIRVFQMVRIELNLRDDFDNCFEPLTDEHGVCKVCARHISIHKGQFVR